MKKWTSDQPRAKQIAQKRTVIVAAAKTAFLATGYAGTTMEAIARCAGVSPMTIYRHAQNKDDLFAAVVASACEPASEGDRAALEAMLLLPMPSLLHATAMHMQETLLRADTLALLRLVIAESVRFPQLGGLAYDGLVGRFERISAWVFAERAETSAWSDSDRMILARRFVDELVGTELLRALMGLDPPAHEQMARRGERARDVVLSAMQARTS